MIKIEIDHLQDLSLMKAKIIDNEWHKVNVSNSICPVWSGNFYIVKCEWIESFWIGLNQK